MAKKTCTQRLADLSLLKINHAENNYQKKNLLVQTSNKDCF